MTRLAWLLGNVRWSVEEQAREITGNSSEKMPRLDFKIVGPAGSTTLREMIRETQTRKNALRRVLASVSSRAGIEIYSPSATASARILLPPEKQEDYQGCEEAPSRTSIGQHEPESNDHSLGRIEDAFHDVNINFTRTIASDNKLAKAIVCDEFSKRRIDVRDPKHVVVLLAEWDTFYGRALPETFERILRHERKKLDDSCKVSEAGTETAPCPCGVCRYSYFRGLDGEIPVDLSNKTGTGKTTTRAPPDPDSLERPWGDSQLDYLRQLAQKINRDLNDYGKRNPYSTDREVKAVGVLGSDVYDKLLIFQALRDRFPQAIFFTTDLDSRYRHPLQYPSTRNLIVASGFGLESELYATHGPQLPPFRDSYQTAIFDAVLRAISGERTSSLMQTGSLESELDQTKTPQLEAKLFEVGRTEFVQLNAGREIPRADVIAWARDKGSKLVAFAQQQRLGILAWGEQLEKGEFTSVESAQPADSSTTAQTAAERVADINKRLWLTALFTGATVLMVFFIWALISLKKVRQLVALAVCMLLSLLALLAAFIWMQDGEESLSLWDGVSIWTSEAIRLVALWLSVILLIAGRRLLRHNAKQLTDRYRLGTKPDNSADRNRSTPLRKCILPYSQVVDPEVETIEVRQLWASYLGYDPSASPRRMIQFWKLPGFWRVLPLVLVSASVLALVAFSNDYVPVRGNVGYITDRVILGLAIGAFAATLMYVINATLMCQRFIKHLSSKPSKYPQETIDRFAEERGMAEDSQPSSKPIISPRASRTNDLVEWLDIQLVADRTRAVATLIYFPFVILLLLWVSYNDIFDQWHLSWEMLSLLLMHAALAVYCAYTLRRAAETARREARDHMDIRLSEAIRNDDKRASQLRLLIEEVENNQEGAFRPISQQPLLKALLVPLTGASGVLALEYLIAG